MPVENQPDEAHGDVALPRPVSGTGQESPRSFPPITGESPLLDPRGGYWKVLMTLEEAALDDRFSDGFREAGEAVLEFLSTRIPFGLWMLTRVDGHDQIVLQSADVSYGVKDGDTFSWSDSYCSRMVRGEAPRVAPRSQEIPAFVVAQSKQSMPIKSYIGVPIMRSDGSLFGTLCAIDSHPQPASIAEEQPLIELLAFLLGSLLQRDLMMLENHRRAERAELASLSDALTEIGNRRAWDRLIDTEEQRLSKFRDSASIVVLDLDNLKEVNDEFGHAAGDELLRQAAECLKTVVRSRDFLARVGGDEFAILALEVGHEKIDEFALRIQTALENSNISASVGWSSRDQVSSLHDAWGDADARMYEAKSLRRKSRLS